MSSSAILLFFITTLILGVYSGTTFTINNSEDFINLASEASSTTYDTVVLASDIDMSGKTDLVPIGNSKTRKFNTLFDGQGYIIKNLQLTSDETDVGIFGYFNGGTVQKLVIDKTCNVTSKSATSIGGVIGRVKATKSSKIDQIVSMATVKFTGELTGYNVLKFGGIVGSCEGSYATTFSNCVNYGTVSFEGSTSDNNDISIGGIVGVYNGDSSASISGCINYGDVSCTRSSTDKVYIGGIIGYSSNSFTTSNILNFGSVTSNTGTPGSLVGLFPDSTVTTSGSYWKEGTADKAYGTSGSVSDDGKTFNSSLMLEDGTSLADKLGNEFTLLKFNEPSVENMIVHKTDPYVLLPTPTREGDSFLGWYIEPELNTLFDKDHLKSGEMTLYGKWSSAKGDEPIGDDPSGGDEPIPPGGGDEPTTQSSSSILSLPESSSSSVLPLPQSSSSTILPLPQSSSSSSSILPPPPQLSSSSSSSKQIETSDNGTVIIPQDSSDESECVDKPNWTFTAGCYVIYILDKEEYSVKFTPINDQIDFSRPDEITIGHGFTGWYTDENLTTRANFTKMPRRNVTLYGETFTQMITVEFDSRVISNEEDGQIHIIKLLDDMCKDCYVIIKIISDDGQVRVILGFKDVQSAQNFLEIIQSDPTVAKVEFVKPFNSAGDDTDRVESNNGPFVALIIIFALLLAIVIAVALVLYPFLIRSGCNNYDSEKDAGIEMSDNANYFDDNDDAADGGTFDETAYNSNIGTAEGAITASLTICDSVGPSVVDRVVPVKTCYDSGAYPTSEMKIDSIYTDDYVPPQNSLASIQNALISAGLTTEESQRIVNSACGGGNNNTNINGSCEENEDPFVPIRVYAYDEATDDASEKRVPNMINKALIGGEPDELAGIRDILFLVMASLRMMPVAQDLTLYCGSRMKVTDAPGYSKDNFVFWPGFASATTDKTYAREMLRGKDGREEYGTLFVIEHGCGYRIKEYSKMGSLDVPFEEILIEPERKFRVREVVKESKKVSVVVLDMVDSPPPKVFDNIV